MYEENERRPWIYYEVKVESTGGKNFVLVVEFFYQFNQ